MYLAVPDPSSAFILLTELALRKVEVRQEDELLSFDLFPEAMSMVSAWWSTIHRIGCTQEPQYAVMPKGKRFTVSNAALMRPLGELVRHVASSWIIEMIRDKRLTTFFQPIVRVAEPGQIFAHECLTRGVRPKGELVSPDRVFEAARNERVLTEVDRASRVGSITAFGRARAAGKAFVNVNPTVAFGAADMAATTAAVRAAGLKPEQIVFEIIESDNVADERRLVRIADSYRSKGFGVALDDFGSGYSGLKFLSAMRPDYVKLDKKLIQNIDQDPYRQRMAEQILTMARRLGATSVVEGIEREGEYHFVREAGADLAQGYLFGRPSAEPALRMS